GDGRGSDVTEGHLDDVWQVSSPIRHHASSVIPEPAEVREGVRVDSEAIGVEGMLRRWPEPHFPIESGHRRAVRRISEALLFHVAVVPGADKTDLAKLAAAHDLAR